MGFGYADAVFSVLFGGLLFVLAQAILGVRMPKWLAVLLGWIIYRAVGVLLSKARVRQTRKACSLHQPLLNSDTTETNRRLDLGAPVNQTGSHDHDGRDIAPTPKDIFDVVSSGDAELTRQCLENAPSDLHVQVNDTDSFGDTPLHLAARKGETKIVDLLIHSGADVSLKDRKGHTALHLAVRYGRSDAAMLLTQAGAAVSERNNSDWTPLHCAARRGDLEVVKTLIERGADINARDATYKWSPLFWAAAKGHADVVRLLIDRGADIASRKYGRQPLYMAAHFGDPEKAQPIYGYSADPNAADNWLLSAARLSRPGEIRVLLECGADANVTDDNGHTPLLVAARDGRTEDVKLLIEHGAKVNVASKPQRFTPLHHATEHGHTETMKLLLEHGAKTEARLDDGETAVFLCWGIHDEGRRMKVLGTLKEYGADFNARNSGGSTALHCAAGRQDTVFAAQLLELGADVNAQDRDGDTALHLAVKLRHTPSVKLLMTCKADPNVRNARGETAIDLAAGDAGNAAIMSLLDSHSG